VDNKYRYRSRYSVHPNQGVKLSDSLKRRLLDDDFVLTESNSNKEVYQGASDALDNASKVGISTINYPTNATHCLLPG
jgi:hypothetical protein